MIVNYELRKEIEWFIKGHQRRIDEYNQILSGGRPFPDGMPRGSDKSDPTATRAIELCSLETELAAIDQASVAIMGSRDGYDWETLNPVDAFMKYDYFLYVTRDKWRKGYSEKSWQRYREEFILIVAKNLGKI